MALSPVPARSAAFCLLLVVIACAAARAQTTQETQLDATQTPVRIELNLLNGSTGETWFTREGRPQRMAGLRGGRQILGAMSWQLEDLDGSAGVLKLGGAPGEAQRPEITGIAVGRRAHELFFLHTYDPGPALQSWRLRVALEKRKFNKPPEPPVLFSYVVQYEDGQRLEIPVRWGESIEDWYRTGTVPELPWAQPAWVRIISPLTGEKLVLYAMRWPNARPQIPISTIDIVSGNDWLHDYGTAAVLGITTSSRPPGGRSFYVAMPPYGDDANPGTFEKPWATLHKAAAELQAGDTVYVRGGRYSIAHEIEPKVNGAESAWITYAGYPGETAVIYARDHLLDPQRQRPIKRDGPFDHDNGEIHLVDRHYIRIKGLHIEESRRCGVFVHGSSHVELRDLTIHRTYNSSIYVGGDSEHVKILNVTASQPNCKIMDSDVRTGEYQMTPHPAHEGITIGGARHFEVAFCEVYGCDKEGIDVKGPNRHGRVHHNYIHHCMAIGIYIDSWSGTLGDLEVDHNTVHDACGIMIASEGGTPVDNVRLHHNLIYDCPSSGIAISGNHTTNVQISNNTIYNCGDGYVKMGWSGGGIFLTSENLWDIAVRDNIVAGNAQFQIGTSGQDPAEHRFTIERNLIQLSEKASSPSESRDQVVPVEGENPIVADPQFADAPAGDLRLRPGSPAVGAGDVPNTDLGALPAGVVLAPGLDLSGRILSTWRGPNRFDPITIAPRLLNAHVHHRGRDGGWFAWRSMYDYDIRQVPAGRQLLGDVEWQIADYTQTAGPSILMLKGEGSYTDDERIEGIAVDQKADELFFLHTYHEGRATESWRDSVEQAQASGNPAPAPPVVMHYVVKYADGTAQHVPVRVGQEIAHWKRFGELGHLPNAQVAWMHRADTWRRRSGRVPGGLFLYSMRWTNPRPDVEIASIDVVSANTPEADYGAAAVIAITAGSRH